MFGNLINSYFRENDRVNNLELGISENQILDAFEYVSSNLSRHAVQNENAKPGTPEISVSHN